ncbi:amino acid ABC transporter substrate-binding protein [Rhodospirillaceae bacterium SYSU D60014]|uniref:amino acid ABC transporter substrate-binding protein n=1 Tax=Virgifigura deserti TaxID=2268457 RepID=UPI0013C4A6BF
MVGSTALRFAPARAQDGGVIRFGGSLGMSGRYAETGLNIRHGYETAIKYLNEEMGGVEIGGKAYRFELGIVDDASDPARATTLIQRQVDEGVDFFLGSYGSNVVLPCAGITEAAGKIMVQVGASADQIFTQGYDYIFGLFPRASRAWVTSIELFKTIEPKPKSVSIIATNGAFSKLNAEAAAAGCKEIGIEVLDVLELPEQVTDASSALATIRSRTPDILITTTVDQNSLVIVRQMIATETNVPLLYQFLGPQLPAYRESLGAKATGVIMQLPWDASLDFSDPVFGDTESYISYYNETNKRPLSYHTVGASACITTYVEAMRAAGSIDPAAVRDALDAIDITTAFGPVKFTEDGDGDPILMGAKIGQVQDGKIKVIFPTDFKTGELVYPTPTWAQKG